MMFKLTAKFYNSAKNDFITVVLAQTDEKIIKNYKNNLENIWNEIQLSMSDSMPPYIIQIDDFDKDGNNEYFKIYKYLFDPFEIEKLENGSDEFISVYYKKTETALMNLLNMINSYKKIPVMNDLA